MVYHMSSCTSEAVRKNLGVTSLGYPQNRMSCTCEQLVTLGFIEEFFFLGTLW